jgi:predicted nucleotidyltransferase
MPYAKPTLKTARKIAQRLVKKFHPERIILFGSLARGNATPDSDIDLLVILPLKNPRRQKADLEVAMRVAVHDIKCAKDIVILTPEELEREKHIPGTLAMPAAHEGVNLYVRRARRSRRAPVGRQG